MTIAACSQFRLQPNPGHCVSSLRLFAINLLCFSRIGRRGASFPVRTGGPTRNRFEAPAPPPPPYLSILMMARRAVAILKNSDKRERSPSRCVAGCKRSATWQRRTRVSSQGERGGAALNNTAEEFVGMPVV